MRPYILYTLGIAFLLSLGSCKKSEESVDLNFKLEYEGSPMVMFQDYSYPDGRTFRLQLASFYLSDLTVSKDNKAEVLSEVEYLVISDAHETAASAAIGYQLTKELTVLTDIDNISFNIGLTPEQNATVPEDYTSDNSLSLTSEYWRSWNSYIYVKLEGAFDINENGTYDPGEFFSLHLGTDDSLNSFSTTMDYYSVDIVMAIDKIFNYGGELYDIETNPRLHSLTPEILASMAFLTDGIEAGTEIK